MFELADGKWRRREIGTNECVCRTWSENTRAPKELIQLSRGCRWWGKEAIHSDASILDPCHRENVMNELKDEKLEHERTKNTGRGKGFNVKKWGKKTIVKAALEQRVKHTNSQASARHVEPKIRLEVGQSLFIALWARATYQEETGMLMEHRCSKASSTVNMLS